ncbi:MAG TPA: AmmeMemoRadiSam system protein B [Thermoanaerobaculia bacterium]
MAIRQPAVAGLFYDARPERLERDVTKFFPEGIAVEPAIGAVVPHAGYVYSGPVAGAVYGRLRMSRVAVVLCPNHTGRGAPAALDPSEAWRTPLGDVPLSRRLADRLLELAPSIEEDAEAHRREHSLEVQLPFLQILRPDVELVPICLGETSLALCREVGQAIAKLVSAETERPVVLASSDMNHYESRQIGRAKDDLALARIEALDAEALFQTVLAKSVSMCGFLPATALLFAARDLEATRARVVARRDSGDETGDDSSVVGYAGVVIT